jgi:TorA maturation chaperone TorD
MDRIDESLHRTALWAFLAAAFRGERDLGPLARELAPAAAALGLDAGAVLSAAPAPPDAHDRLFGHTASGPCPAYEGEYGEPRGFRYAHEIGDVQGTYRAFGLRPSRERADHVATECEFLAFLALKEACARRVDGEAKADLCRDAAAGFLRDHLGRFGRALAARVRARAGEPFHRAAADLLDAAILRDAERLGVAAGPGDLPLREDTGTPDDACVRCGLAAEAPR